MMYDACYRLHRDSDFCRSIRIIEQFEIHAEVETFSVYDAKGNDASTHTLLRIIYVLLKLQCGEGGRGGSFIT